MKWCKDCFRSITDHNASGFCGRCQGKHRCVVCDRYFDFAIKTYCDECHLLVRRLAEIGHNTANNGFRKKCRGDRVELYAERADRGEPLFDNEREES
jgi:hypothetical protein